MSSRGFQLSVIKPKESLQAITKDTNNTVNSCIGGSDYESEDGVIMTGKAKKLGSGRREELNRSSLVGSVILL